VCVDVRIADPQIAQCRRQPPHVHETRSTRRTRFNQAPGERAG
jgi:hypothetical protein